MRALAAFLSPVATCCVMQAAVPPPAPVASIHLSIRAFRRRMHAGFADVLQPGTPVLLSVSTKQPDYARHLAPHR